MILKPSGNSLCVWVFVSILMTSWMINRTLSTPDSDSEEHTSARGGWPPLSGTRSHGSLPRKRRSTSSPTSLLSSEKSLKKKHKHLSLLLEEAGLSSSDDSFDQGYWPNLRAIRRLLSSQTSLCLRACVLVWSSLRQLFFGFFLLRLCFCLTISTSLAAGLSAELPYFFKTNVYLFLRCFLMPGLQTVL